MCHVIDNVFYINCCFCYIVLLYILHILWTFQPNLRFVLDSWLLFYVYSVIVIFVSK